MSPQAPRLQVGFTMRDLLKDWGNQLEYVVICGAPS